MPPIKAVNLGGWLVTEGWIKPSLFDAIPNKDFLDGTQLQLKSVTQQKYLCAENGGGTNMVVNRANASTWETFKIWRVTESTFQFRVFNGQFIGINQGNGNQAVSTSTDPGPAETFEIIVNENDSSRVRLRASNGLFLQAKTDVLATADYPQRTNWGNDDPSVFLMSIVYSLQGEFQLTNGYGRSKAKQVLTEHWNTFIVEDDFKFMSQSKLDAVRIPVGWWIASDPTPPWPYVGGSLQALDNAFTWAEKYNLKVIVDLHAAPGSQNPYEHSASRDSSQDWGNSEANINQTVQVIDFLADRYAKRPSLLAIELLNEPLPSHVLTLDVLKNYYQAGYNAVRNHTSNAYVIMSNRLAADPKELLQFASGFQGSVIDVHYYNLFEDFFNSLNVQQNIDFVYNGRASDLSAVTLANGPLVLVGEWSAEWKVNGASKEEYQRFAKAELDVFGRATFGWAYWSWKNAQNHWSLEWMIRNGYITL